MLQKLQWPTLEERRKKARLTLLYKVANGKVKIDAGNKLLPPDRVKTLQAHQRPIFPDTIMQDQHQERVLLSKTIRDWNNLPAQVTAAESLDSFKKLLLTY